jgi:TPR repeat protein/Flp pilus assembly protein TadD
VTAVASGGRRGARPLRTPALDRILALFSAPAALRRAAALIAAGRHQAGFRLYGRAARGGIAEAEYRVGICYLNGLGTPRSRLAALRWLEQSGRHQHAEAQSLLAVLCLHGLASRPSHASTATAQLFAAETPSQADYAAAERWARMAAESGSPDGQAVLAFILGSGPEAMRNVEEADRWYERSAAGGSAHGKLGHALALSRRGGEACTTEAAAQLAGAAAAGLPTACYLLGVVTANGVGAPRDETEAAALFQRAAEAGHRSGQLRWGLALLHGLGVEPNPSQGESWLRRAALAGDAEAAVRVGQLYAGGDEAQANPLEAMAWFRRAAEAGRIDATHALGRLNLADADEAARWFRIAAAAGDPAAHAELGNLALRGGGEREDEIRACAWFAQAAAAGDRLAAFNYGVCLAQGVGVARDDAQAAVWLRKAAEGGLAQAQYWYGRLLLQGRGVVQDPKGGRAWIRRAADAGMPEAQAALGETRTGGGGAPAPGIGDPDPPLAPPQDALAQTSMDQPTMRQQIMQAAAPAAPHQDLAVNASSEVFCACGSGLRSCRCCELDPGYAAPPDQVDPVGRLAVRAAEAMAAGDAAAAATLCLEVLEIAPRHPAILWILFQIHQQAGRQPAAMALLRRLVGVDPNRVDATQELAMRLFQAGDLPAAEQHARNAVRLAPNHPASHNLMGMILTEAQRPQTAEFHYRRVLDLSAGRDPILLANLAWNLKGQGRLDEARELYRESVAAAPEIFQTLYGWAQLEEADRDFGAARRLLDQAARLRPEDAGLRVARATLLTRQGQHLSALAEFEPDPSRGAIGAADPLETDSNALLERGRILDRLGRYDEAFASFEAAKKIARERIGRRYLDAQAREMADRLRRFFVADRLQLMARPPQPEAGAQPIFILGFPRSGTTLAEQALCAHPAISAGDELPFVNELTDATPRLLGSPLSYPEALAELWMGDNRRGLETLARCYLQKVETRGSVKPGSHWFTDKMPLNETHLGLIALIFPASPLIHVLRHPLDVVLSVYSHHLTHGYFCAYELETIARHYLLVMELVQHYRCEMALRYLPLRYEDMVDDMTGSVRRILDFIGEPFEERCVRFQDNRRLPNTPSYSQVSEKLYDRSRYRYRHYLRHLESVIPILQPAIDRLGYRVEAGLG